MRFVASCDLNSLRIILEFWARFFLFWIWTANAPAIPPSSGLMFGIRLFREAILHVKAAVNHYQTWQKTWIIWTLTSGITWSRKHKTKKTLKWNIKPIQKVNLQVTPKSIEADFKELDPTLRKFLYPDEIKLLSDSECFVNRTGFGSTNAKTGCFKKETNLLKSFSKSDCYFECMLQAAVGPLGKKSQTCAPCNYPNMGEIMF